MAPMSRRMYSKYAKFRQSKSYNVCVYYCISFDRSLLLSSKGLELPKLSQRLEALNATKTFESLEPVGATDIQVIYVFLLAKCYKNTE